MTRPCPTSILSIDIGRKRIGLAGCDPLGITVTPLPAIYRNSLDQDIKKLRNHCKTRNVKGLVIGLPLNEDGENTQQTIHCQKYGIRIAKELSLPLAWVNEHSSTWLAGEKFNLNNDRSGKLDSAAAVILLEQWLKEGPELLPVKTAKHYSGKDNFDNGSLEN